MVVFCYTRRSDFCSDLPVLPNRKSHVNQPLPIAETVKNSEGKKTHKLVTGEKEIVAVLKCIKNSRQMKADFGHIKTTNDKNLIKTE